MKRVGSLAVIWISVLAMVLSVIPAASATEGYETASCLLLATEPEQASGYVSYYHNGEEVAADQMTWVDGGVHGKALSLDGQSDYLEIGFYQLRMAQMTFSTWINFRGAVDPANPASAYWQRLFTISSGADRYFSVSPHAYDTTVKNAQGQLDGVYMEYYRGDTEEGGEAFSLKSFTGARAGQSSFGLPQNEWHHMAVVSDGQTAKLYIDGNLILDEILMMGVVQMYAESMTIGKGIWSDPMLNALLDDTMIFEKALTASEIAALMQTGDPAQLSTADTSATQYLPTQAPTTIAPLETTAPADKPNVPFGLPMWGFRLVVILLALFIVMTVAVNLYELNWRKNHPKETKESAAASGEEPSISIKEAAKRKRQQEHEKFLSEEEDEHKNG